MEVGGLNGRKEEDGFLDQGRRLTVVLVVVLGGRLMVMEGSWWSTLSKKPLTIKSEKVQKFVNLKSRDFGPEAGEFALLAEIH
jgi:hypothetical protein